MPGKSFRYVFNHFICNYYHCWGMGVSSGFSTRWKPVLPPIRESGNIPLSCVRGLWVQMFFYKSILFALVAVITSSSFAVDRPSSATSEATVAVAAEIVNAAKAMTSLPTRYKMSYPKIAYPAGDIDPREGLCCDVVVRALRAGGIDLQELVYEDYLSEPGPYRRARMGPFQRGIDKSWAHRRTALLDVFFSRKALTLPTKYSSKTAEEWRPGDIVIYKRNGWETWHIALISDATAPKTAEPLLIDAWQDPGKVSQTHTLTSFGTIGGHYRIPDSMRDGLSSEHMDRARKAWAGYEEALRVTRIATGTQGVGTSSHSASGG